MDNLFSKWKPVPILVKKSLVFMTNTLMRYLDKHKTKIFSARARSRNLSSPTFSLYSQSTGTQMWLRLVISPLHFLSESCAFGLIALFSLICPEPEALVWREEERSCWLSVFSVLGACLFRWDGHDGSDRNLSSWGMAVKRPSHFETVDKLLGGSQFYSIWRRFLHTCMLVLTQCSLRLVYLTDHRGLVSNRFHLMIMRKCYISNALLMFECPIETFIVFYF